MFLIRALLNYTMFDDQLFSLYSFCITQPLTNQLFPIIFFSTRGFHRAKINTIILRYPITRTCRAFCSHIRIESRNCLLLRAPRKITDERRISYRAEAPTKSTIARIGKCVGSYISILRVTIEFQWSRIWRELIIYVNGNLLSHKASYCYCQYLKMATQYQIK